MKTTNEQINIIKFVTASFRKISDRIEVLRHLGYTVSNAPMGSGGVGQQKTMKDGSIRIQIGYGVTKHNYADIVII